MFDSHEPKSLEEMLLIIENIGIKREIIESYFPTVKDITELYHLVEKKVHAKNEQEMILRLRAYVEKMNYELLESLGKTYQNTK